MLLDMFFADITESARQHDRLMVASQLTALRTRDLFLVGSKITAEIGATKLIIERSAANRPLQHDVQCRHDALRFSIIMLPRLFSTGNPQIGDRKTGQSSLGLGAFTGRAFIANLST